MYWYCWTVCLCACWKWLGPLWWWKVLPNFLLTIGSIIFGEIVVIMSTYNTYRFSNTSYIVNGNISLSWCIYGLRSIFIYSNTNGSYVSLEVVKFWNFHDVFTCEVVCLYCFVIQQINFAYCLNKFKVKLWEWLYFYKAEWNYKSLWFVSNSSKLRNIGK